MVEKTKDNINIHLNKRISMVGFIIWLVGLILTIKACLEIWKLPVDGVKKLLAIIVLLITSWVGLLVYYFFAKDKLAGWLK